jgi:O-antigen/teichoic acid export membrane protein
LIQRRLELQHVTKADMSAGLVALAVVFLLAWRGAGVWSLVASSLARTAVRAALLYYYSPWLPGLRAGSARTRNILSFSVGTFSSRAVWSIYDQSDNFILGKVAGEYALGFYTMARDIASIPVTRISSAVNQLSVPLMATLQQAPAAMRNMLLRGLRLTASVSIPACVGIALVADDLVQVALSDKWRSIVPILRVLCGIALIKSLDVLIAPVLRARYRTTYLATYNVVLLVIMPLSFLVGARLAGSIGVAWAWLVAYPIVMSRMATTAFREIDLSWRVALAQLRTPALAALLMTPVVLAVRALIVGDEWRIAFARLLASSCIGAVAYIASIWFMGGPLKGEMLEIASWLFRPAQRDVK